MEKKLIEVYFRLVRWLDSIYSKVSSINNKIVFISCDNDLKKINEYFGIMTWIVTHFKSEAKSKIEEIFAISSKP